MIEEVLREGPGKGRGSLSRREDDRTVKEGTPGKTYSHGPVTRRIARGLSMGLTWTSRGKTSVKCPGVRPESVRVEE